MTWAQTYTGKHLMRKENKFDWEGQACVWESSTKEEWKNTGRTCWNVGVRKRGNSEWEWQSGRWEAWRQLLMFRGRVESKKCKLSNALWCCKFKRMPSITISILIYFSWTLSFRLILGLAHEQIPYKERVEICQYFNLILLYVHSIG